MKKYIFVICAAVCGSILLAQITEYPSSLDSSDAVAAPPSNIEFLRRSLEASDLSGTASSAEPTNKPAATPKAASTKESNQQTPVVPPANPVSPATSQATATVSDLPLTPAVEKEMTAEEAAEAAELDYAARMMQQAKKEANQGRFIPQTPNQTGYVPRVNTTAGKAYNPNEYRPGVEWKRTNSNHFIIYTQKRNGGIGSSNMSMIFESSYETLRRNIPWMMSDKVRVFVYQDHTNYLKYEPNAKAWTRALAYPTRGEIVVYDEPGKQQELKEVFTHELVHIFTQKFFDKHKTGRLMTPTWLDEGLAVYIEDQAYNGGKGGPWSKDLKTLNLRPSPNSAGFASSNRSSNAIGRKGAPVYFMSFSEFMKESSLATMESRGKTQDWYLQAYSMVQFLLNPSWGTSPSNRMQFQQFTNLIAQGEQVRDPVNGFVKKDANGQPIYRPYSVEKALSKAYRYTDIGNFEDAFWRWESGQR